MVFGLFVLRFPDLPEAALANDVQIVEKRLLNFGDLVLIILEELIIFLELLLGNLLAFLLLVGVVLGVVHVEAGFLLSIDHEVVGHLVVNIVEVDMGQVVLGGFLIEMVQRAFLTGDGTFVLVPEPFLFEGLLGIFGLLVLQ